MSENNETVFGPHETTCDCDDCDRLRAEYERDLDGVDLSQIQGKRVSKEEDIFREAVCSSCGRDSEKFNVCVDMDGYTICDDCITILPRVMIQRMKDNVTKIRLENSYLVEALEGALNFIEDIESAQNICLDCADIAREALNKARPDK